MIESGAVTRAGSARHVRRVAAAMISRRPLARLMMPTACGSRFDQKKRRPGKVKAARGRGNSQPPRAGLNRARSSSGKPQGRRPILGYPSRGTRAKRRSGIAPGRQPGAARRGGRALKGAEPQERRPAGLSRSGRAGGAEARAKGRSGCAEWFGTAVSARANVEAHACLADAASDAKANASRRQHEAQRPAKSEPGGPSQTSRQALCRDRSRRPSAGRGSGCIR